MAKGTQHNDEEVIDDLEVEETTEEGGNLSCQAKLKKVKAELKNIKAEKQDYLIGWQRAKADLVNYQKNKDKELLDRTKFANQRLLEDLLPVADSFDAAMANKEAWEAIDGVWRTGVEYIYSQLTKTLEDYGVTKMPVKPGDKLDPDHHEPLKTEPTKDKKQADTIASVIHHGYMISDKVLRPAKVSVYNLES